METVDDAQAQAEAVGGQAPPGFEHQIELEDVSFGYSEEEPVIDGVTLTIAKGRITCLVGESGSGKSTLADLVIGLIRPRSGRIMVDGTPLTDIGLAAWRSTIGYVPQDNLLLHDTVLANIALGDETITEVEAAQALRAAGAAEFVEAMAEGMHTVVGERGARLSGGQRQRIMIARALAHRPSLLVLDEATSALDAASESAICETLSALKNHLTILAVTHQSALRRIGDVVYYVENGSVTLSPELEHGHAGRSHS
jgi:ATP-binding cassette subfamily C protein